MRYKLAMAIILSGSASVCRSHGRKCVRMALMITSVPQHCGFSENNYTSPVTLSHNLDIANVFRLSRHTTSRQHRLRLHFTAFDNRPLRRNVFPYRPHHCQPLHIIKRTKLSNDAEDSRDSGASCLISVYTGRRVFCERRYR